MVEFHRRAAARDGLNSACKPCNVAAALDYAKRNAERVAAYQAAWTQENRDKRAANIAAWRARNPERAKQLGRERSARARARGTAATWEAANKTLVSATKAKWKRANLAAVAADAARRRAQELRAMPPWVNRAEVDMFYQRAREQGLTVDHIVPLRSRLVCGLHVPANLRLLSRRENVLKNNRHWPDMPPVTPRSRQHLGEPLEHRVFESGSGHQV